MKMPITFIAVQCFQCSTMQVKQQKKSSNKWNCVVCNEKQSLCKVFAQGFMAKDIRKFVQNFNMSRQKQDEQRAEGGGEILLDSPINEEKRDNKKKMRSDWSEYIDVDDDGEECCGNSGSVTQVGDGELEPIIVTEMPKALFKKPKLKDCSISGSEFGNSGKKLLKPVFPNRGNKNARSQDMQLTELQQTYSQRASKRSDHPMPSQEMFSIEEPVELHRADRALKWNALRSKIQENNDNLSNRESYLYQSNEKDKGSVSKWSDYIAQDDDDDDECRSNGVPPGRLSQATAAKKPASKWSSFITEEDHDDLQIRERRGPKDQVSQWNSDAFESLMNDERVEDDIHPDFL